jgi:hypothetical protein
MGENKPAGPYIPGNSSARTRGIIQSTVYGCIFRRKPQPAGTSCPQMAGTPCGQGQTAPAGMPAGTNSDVFAKQKRKAAEWQGCHSAAAQGIERKYRRPPEGPRNWSDSPVPATRSGSGDAPIVKRRPQERKRKNCPVSIRGRLSTRLFPGPPCLKSRAAFPRGSEDLHGRQIEALKTEKPAAPGKGGVPGDFEMQTEQAVRMGGLWQDFPLGYGCSAKLRPAGTPLHLHFSVHL